MSQPLMCDGFDGAVVAALRDEMHCLNDITVISLILGGAGEKAAGVPTREDGPDVVISSVQAPAADPAVCAWRMVGKTFANAGCEDEYLWSHEYKVCPSCGKPIAFKEVTK